MSTLASPTRSAKENKPAAGLGGVTSASQVSGLKTTGKHAGPSPPSHPPPQQPPSSITRVEDSSVDVSLQTLRRVSVLDILHVLSPAANLSGKNVYLLDENITSADAGGKQLKGAVRAAFPNHQALDTEIALIAMLPDVLELMDLSMSADVKEKIKKTVSKASVVEEKWKYETADKKVCTIAKVIDALNKARDPAETTSLLAHIPRH